MYSHSANIDSSNPSDLREAAVSCGFKFAPLKNAFLKEAKSVKKQTNKKKQVQSLLLETQHNKWESTQRNSLFSYDREGNDTHLERKGVGICPTAEEYSKWQLSHFYRTVLLGLCLHLASYLVSFLTPDLS